MDVGIPTGENDPLKKRKRRPAPIPTQMPGGGGGNKGPMPTRNGPAKGAYPSRSSSAPTGNSDDSISEALRRRLKKRKNPMDDARAVPGAGQKGGGFSGPFPGPSRVSNPHHSAPGGRASMPTRK